jgi:hypothetical protein
VSPRLLLGLRSPSGLRPPKGLPRHDQLCEGSGSGGHGDQLEDRLFGESVLSHTAGRRVTAPTGRTSQPSE